MGTSGLDGLGRRHGGLATGEVGAGPGKGQDPLDMDSGKEWVGEDLEGASWQDPFPSKWMGARLWRDSK
jgi:hypothetical protein